MKALTLRQPWAGAVMMMGKDVENRSQLWTHRGPLLIHAGGHLATAAEFDDVRRISGQPVPILGLPGGAPAWEMGAIVGVVDLTDAHRASDCDRYGGLCSRWAQPGKVHLQLANPRQLRRPVPCPGRQGLWTPSDDVLAEVQEVWPR